MAAHDPADPDHESAKAYLQRRGARSAQRQRLGLDSAFAPKFSMIGNTLQLDLLGGSADPRRLK